MRVVFFGSPEFAVPTLEALASDRTFEVALVVTQGARAASPVERAAARLGLPVYQPSMLRDEVSRQPLVDARADVFVVAAFGLIFKQRTLDIPRFGAINIHPSILPKYRGASPIMATIESGDQETGVSLMEMDAGIDTGAVVSLERIVVEGDDTTESLGGRLARVAAGQSTRDIPRWVDGELRAVPQSTAGATLTRPLTKLDGLIDWRRSAVEIARTARAMWPWPRAWTTVAGSPLQVHQALVFAGEQSELQPGELLPIRRRIVVACGEGALELLTVEPAGRRPMPANAYLNGLRVRLERLGDPVGPPERPPLIVPVPIPCEGKG